MRILAVSPLVAGLLCLPAAAAIAEPAGLVAAMRASAAEEPAFVLSASGTHVYQCRAAATNPSAFAWSFVAPDATLYEGARSVGVHKSVNLWESTSDRSSVAGTLRGTQGAGAGDLPWALFRAQPMGADGLFAGVTSIQRVNTSRGLPPAQACTASNEGAEARVEFTADFYFYKRRGAA